MIVEVLKNKNSLYKIMYEAEVNMIKDILTINKLYQCLGYITLAVARKLIQNELVTSLKLDSNKEVNMFCKLYVYAKIT